MCIHFCGACNHDTDLLTIDEAAAEVSVCRRTMHYWIKRGRLHLMEDGGGHTLICKRSLVEPYTKTR